MEQSEKQLRENIEVVIQWLNKYRPHVAGLGAPILMLKRSLEDVDLSEEIDLTKEVIVKEPEVIDMVELQTAGDLKKFLNNK